MGIKFVGTASNLFNRLGKLALLLKQCGSYQASQYTNLIDPTNGVVAQYNGEPDIQGMIGTSYIGALNSPGSAIGALAGQVAAATINRMVFRDNPQINQNLQAQNLTQSIFEMIRQMRQQGQTVLAATIGATPTAFTGVGNGVILMSVNRPLDGLVLENTFAETLTVSCVADSYIGGAVAGNELFSVTGQGAENNPYAFDWPLGSNCSLSLNAVDGNANLSSGNLLNNSSFNSWNGSLGSSGFGLPLNYVFDSGSALVSQENGIVYKGSSALKITGDGATLVQFRQQFATPAGTNSFLSPQTQYGFNIFLRRDGVAPGAGNLIIELVDGGGNVIQDANGVPNTFTINLTGLTTTYTAYNVAFRTPEQFPPANGYYIRYRNGTALTNGRAVYLDTASLGQMQQLYTSGPFILIFSGSIPFVQSGTDGIGDYAMVNVSNGRGAGGTLATFQTALPRLIWPTWLDNEFLLPSSASPSISDSGLIS